MQTHSKTLLCRYQYDPLDRLVDCELSGQESARRFYQKDHLVTEINGTVKRTIMQYEDQLLAQQQRQSESVETSLLGTDKQRSVLNVIGASTSRPITHTPYGHRPLASGLLSLLGFNGERPDPVTGFYLLGNGYRAFNPVLMRFNSPDSWSPFGEGGINAYAYCSGDPINYSDPTGHGLFSAFSTVTSATKSYASTQWRLFTNNLSSRTMTKNMDEVLIKSIDNYKPTSERIVTSAENAINHAKLIKYRGIEVDSLIEAKTKMSYHISNEQKAINQLQSDVSYDSNSSGPTLIEVSHNRYTEVLESQSLLTIQRTYNLNKKLIEALSEETLKIRTTGT
jgi:RHS repeat-associated protein